MILIFVVKIPIEDEQLILVRILNFGDFVKFFPIFCLHLGGLYESMKRAENQDTNEFLLPHKWLNSFAIFIIIFFFRSILYTCIVMYLHSVESS